MDILLDNPLTNMYGPYFLILYGFVTLFTILFFALIKTRIDQSDRLPVPPIPASIDPYEIAYLRGGINEMARTAIFSLTQKGLLEIKNDEKPPIITRTSISDWRGTATVEDAALNWFVVSRQPKEVFASGGLTSVLEPYADEYLRRLGRQQLITGAEMKKQLSMWKWPALAVILGFGGYKALASIADGFFNVGGLLVIAAAGVTAMLLISKLPRLTKLGKEYLERLQTAFDGLRTQIRSEPEKATAGGPDGFDPLLLSVGIFGGGILAGTAYGAHNDVFARAQKDTGASAGGCGAGCGSCSTGGSSCSSGDGGSSSGCSSGCGGGGCGGGGCGGS